MLQYVAVSITESAMNQRSAGTFAQLTESGLPNILLSTIEVLKQSVLHSQDSVHVVWEKRIFNLTPIDGSF